MVVLIGLSRVYLGVHHPSNALARYAAALVWVMAVVLGNRMLLRRRVVNGKGND